ncbi:hypothetical protein ABIB27_003294 [Arthrobacter sp. UYEF21]
MTERQRRAAVQPLPVRLTAGPLATVRPTAAQLAPAPVTAPLAALPLTTVRLTTAQRVRKVANLANGTTLLGLLLAWMAGTAIRGGPRGLIIAGGYTWRLPAAGAFAVGNMVLCRIGAEALMANPALLGHEEKHCSHYAWCLGLPFLPLYFLAAGWSLLRTGNPASANFFERHAGLAAGGYVDTRSPVPAPHNAGGIEV